MDTVRNLPRVGEKESRLRFRPERRAGRHVNVTCKFCGPGCFGVAPGKEFSNLSTAKTAMRRARARAQARQHNCSFMRYESAIAARVRRAL